MAHSPSPCPWEREQEAIRYHTFIANIKQTTIRQAKYAPTPLAHMVENVLGYMPVYEAGDFGKRSWYHGCGTSRTAV